MNEINKEHYDWFNKLPLERVDSSTYQRTCACGETVWYETDGLKVKSWILRHFKHSEDVNAKEPFKYDWSIPWKFSFKGLQALIEEFGLIALPVAGKKVSYRDQFDNLFVFDVFQIVRNKNYPHKNHCVTFNPQESKINEK